MPHLYGVCHSVQKLNDKQWRDFILDDREKEKLPPVDGDEVVVWGLQDRGHIFRIHRLLFRLEKVIANTSTDDTFPVLLQENISRVINEKQTVDHLVCNSWTIVILVVSMHKRHAFSTLKPWMRMDYSIVHSWKTVIQVLVTVTYCRDSFIFDLVFKLPLMRSYSNFILGRFRIF